MSNLRGVTKHNLRSLKRYTHSQGTADDDSDIPVKSIHGYLSNPRIARQAGVRFAHSSSSQALCRTSFAAPSSGTKASRRGPLNSRIGGVNQAFCDMWHARARDLRRSVAAVHLRCRVVWRLYGINQVGGCYIYTHIVQKNRQANGYAVRNRGAGRVRGD
jgi:hypothetical protein